MEREELIRLIGGSAAAKGKGTPKKVTQAQTESERESPSVPLPHEPDAFWGKDDMRGDFLGEVRIPPVTAAVLKRLGGFPFWRGEEGFADAMEGIYREAAIMGMDVFLGERNVVREG
jgi:uncharacterized Zn finger protein